MGALLVSARTDLIDPDALVTSLSEHLLRWLPDQRWFGSHQAPASVVPVELEVIRREWPLLVWAPLRVTPHGGGEDEFYQLLLGIDRERPEGVAPQFLIGDVPTPDGWGVAYDAVADARLAPDLLAEMAPDIEATTSRVMPGDHSNTSVIFDERWMMKIYRRLRSGPNPDVEVTVALGQQGLDTVPVPVSVWRRHDWDLAIVRRLFPEVPDGLDVASESLRELLSRRVPPREGRLDFRADAELLGSTLARIHLGLAEAFGVSAADPVELRDSMVEHLRHTAPAGVDLDAVEAAYGRLIGTTDLGSFIRIHGDLHLSQALRTRRQWVVIDFEGEPTRPIEDRRRPSSPLRDIAGMIRSFHYAAELALDGFLPDRDAPENDPADARDEVESPRPIDPPERELALLAEAWEERSTSAFLSGYTSIDEVHRLLPAERISRDALLTLFELDKAVYEVAYELGHRPALAPIPQRAVERLLVPGHRERW